MDERKNTLEFPLICIVVLSMLWSFMPFLRAAEQLSISRIEIVIQDAPGDNEYWQKLARSLITVKEGDSFSPESVERSIELLQKSEQFETIHIDSRDTADTLHLIFNLTPFRRIKNIVIENAFPIFEKEVLNAMTIYTGDAYVESELPKQSELIRKVFIEEGFYEPIVDIAGKRDPEDGNYTIFIDVNKGPFLEFDKITIRGNHAFSDTRLKLKMKTSTALLMPGTSGRFVEKNFKKDIDSLKTFYWGKHFPDAVVEYAVDKNKKTNTASAVITIQEGPKYDIDFSGNEEFWGFTLKKDLVLFREGNPNDSGLRKSVENIVQRYKTKGYSDVSVKPVEETTTENGKTIREITFMIDEGPQTIVDTIAISGNSGFGDEKIMAQMLTRPPGFLNNGSYSEDILEEDMAAIRAFYYKNGFLETDVQKTVKISDDKTKVDIALHIDEGVQTMISSVNIKGLKVISNQEACQDMKMKPGEPFRQFLIKDDAAAIASRVSEQGHPYVKIQNDVSISDDQSQADLTYHVDEGPYVKMGDIYFRGNFRTRQKILLNEIELKSEAPFSLRKMLESQKNIRDLDIFNTVNFKTFGLEEKMDEVDLIIETEEKKPYYLEVGGGYDTERGFFLHSTIGDRNLLGLNKDIWASGEISEIGYRVESGISEPRFFGSRITAAFSLFIEERSEFNKNYGIRTYGSSLNFNRKWFKETFTTALNFRYEKREQFQRDEKTWKKQAADVNIDDEFEPRNILVTTPSASYDTRDSLVRPRKGLYSSFAVDISKGLDNSNLDDFFKYRFDARYYYSPIDWLTFAGLGRIGYITPYGSTDMVPDDQLFYLGGVSSVRGFDENMLRYDPDGKPLGGRQAYSGSLEARIDLGLNFELALFYDIGMIEDAEINVGSDELRSSAGAGLRYITPIGPIGFLYGIKLDRDAGESFGELHFSIGYTF